MSLKKLFAGNFFWNCRLFPSFNDIPSCDIPSHDIPSRAIPSYDIPRYEKLKKILSYIEYDFHRPHK